jgi:serine/threonine protein kinase
MVTGTFPFKAINDKAAYLKAMKTELRIPHELSPELCTLLNQLLSFDFKKRPKADEILASDWLAIR